MELPSDVMPLLFQFLDPMSLAIMAQTCRAWKDIVYRTSVWDKYIWSPKPHYASLFGRREGARHIGEPHPLCFLAWAYHLLVGSGKHELPLSINTFEDPAQILRRTYRLWCKNRKPCLHVTHHRWTDVCLLSPTLSKLSESDLEVLRQQLCEGWKEKRLLRCPYASWLDKQLYDHANATAVPLDLFIVDAGGSTPLEQMKSLMVRRTTDLGREISKQQRTVTRGMTESAKALCVHSAREFDDGDTLERREGARLWDGAVFTLKKSD